MNTPQVSVIIPVYNEADTIEEVLKRVLALSIKHEVIVVDDGSEDATVAIARSINDDRLKVITQDFNRGKGAAIRLGLLHAQGQIVAIQDADLEYYPEDLPSLISEFNDPKVVAVYGSRFLDGRPPMRWANYLANRILAISANVLYRGSISDEATCYKLVRTDTLRQLNLRCERFEFCPEVTAKLMKRGDMIKEMPIRYVPRTYGQGKKITWRDGFEALWTLVKFRFVRY